MVSTRLTSFTVLSLLGSLVAAQQGVISNGNSQLPACAQSCPLLVQAAQACSATNTATQSNWVCFCQSAYLNTLRSSAVGICDSVCTNPTDNAQVSTWYNSNCGSDNGASEHASDGNAGGAASSTVAGTTAATASGTSRASATRTPKSSSAANTSGSATKHVGTWWEEHYQWIIMLIVLAILLPVIGFGAVWLKNRHERKMDQIRGGFNAGITERTGPMKDPGANQSGSVAAGGFSGSGRNTPTRTRDAFMPYGYGYSRSESRLESQSNVHPAERGMTPHNDMEKGGPSGAATPSNKKSKNKVLVRERDVQEEVHDEKDNRF
ncbi:hypothetical protein DOTSEDRAFT_92651 [Dothistroma septosporum NZE10]|uniref:Extracellular membrane protein CFEM domain-containing protein n=1 Tax=Dothistroma septosporum (strain NZE10 / CBS 128990) TaxID=675120 RepID=M2WHW3_DOTSN|nr:hypothetical protein DOTSEDRAFT_92651 [Dothistroma septosporum NZE10]